MATKTFNIGEYAVGGRIQVTLTGDTLTINALSWTSKQLVSGQTFHKKTDWDGKTHFEGRPIDNFLNDLTSSYYAGKIMDWIKEKTEVKFAQGGNIDKEIKAKPRGWRFSGENNYKRPNASERGTRGTYFEARRNRSDKNLRKKLEEGGVVEIIETEITTTQQADKFIDIMNEYRPEGYANYDARKPEEYVKWMVTRSDEDGCDSHLFKNDEEFIKYAEDLRESYGQDMLEEETEDEEKFAKGGIVAELNKKYSFTDLFR